MDTLYTTILEVREKISTSFWENDEVQKLFKSIINRIDKIIIPKKNKEQFIIENKYILYKLYDTFYLK